MAYLPKLAPAVGNGLGGLPERRVESIPESIVSNTNNPDNLISIIGYGDMIGSFISAATSTYLYAPLVFGNKVYSLQSPDTVTNAKGYLYTYNPADGSFTKGATEYTSPLTYDNSQSYVMPLFDDHCLNLNTSTNAQVITIDHNDDTLTVSNLVGGIIPESGNYTDGGAAYTLNYIGYCKKINNLLYVLAYNSGSPWSNGMFIVDSNMSIVSSHPINIDTSTNPRFMFTETEYGFCIASSYNTTGTVPLYIRTFDHNMNLIDFKSISRSYTGTGTRYLFNMGKTLDCRGIGLIISTSLNNERWQISGHAAIIDSSGNISDTATYASQQIEYTGDIDRTLIPGDVGNFEWENWRFKTDFSSSIWVNFDTYLCKFFVTTVDESIGTTHINYDSVTNATNLSIYSMGLLTHFKDDIFLSHGRFANGSSTVTLYKHTAIYK